MIQWIPLLQNCVILYLLNSDLLNEVAYFFEHMWHIMTCNISTPETHPNKAIRSAVTAIPWYRTNDASSVPSARESFRESHFGLIRIIHGGIPAVRPPFFSSSAPLICHLHKRDEAINKRCREIPGESWMNECSRGCYARRGRFIYRSRTGSLF